MSAPERIPGTRPMTVSDGQSPLIQVRALSKSFGSKQVLHSIDLDIEKGTTVAIIGKSGTGKSVFLKCLAGLLTPEKGEVYFRDELVNQNPKTFQLFRARMSYMFQDNALFDSMSVLDNICLPLLETRRIKRSEVQEQAYRLLETLDIVEIADKFPSQVSGGMQRRVALARALITEPEIILFDDPTTGLDPIRRNGVFSLISETQKKIGFTALMVSHDIPEVFYISDQVVLIDEGQVALSESSYHIELSQNPTLRSFIDSHNRLENALTGLLDTIQFERHFRNRLISRPAQILLLTISNFERIASELGHIAAQHIFQHIADSLTECLNDWEYATRCGQNQIAALTFRATKTEIDSLTQALRVAVKKIPEMQDEPSQKPCVSFDISMGIESIENEPYDALRFVIDAAEKRSHSLINISCPKHSKLTRPPSSV